MMVGKQWVKSQGMHRWAAEARLATLPGGTQR